MKKRQFYILLVMSLFLATDVVAGDVKEYNETNTKCNEYETECTDLKGVKITGIRKTYYKSGKVKDVDNFKDGKADGVCKRYYENGNLEKEIQYKDGKTDGMLKEYYESGNLATEIQYKDGKTDGVAKRYYEKGNLKTEVPFENGKVNGVVRNYYDTGLVSSEALQKDGKEISHNAFYETGELFHHCENNNGTVNVTLYCTHGKVMMTYAVKNGNIISRKMHVREDDPCFKPTIKFGEELNKKQQQNQK